MRKIVFINQEKQITDYLSHHRSSSPWIDSIKFLSRDRLIKKDHSVIPPDYYGPRFQMIAKKTRTLSIIERIFCIASAVFIIIKSLGKMLHDNEVKSLLFKKTLTIHFAKSISTDRFIKDQKLHSAFNRLKSLSELSETFTLPENICDLLTPVMDDVTLKTSSENLKFYKSQDLHRIFELRALPNLIFKVNLDPRSNHPINDRFEKMLEAQTVIRSFSLHNLKVPKAKLITVSHKGISYQILVEEKLDFSPELSKQKRLFESENPKQQEALCQLATFICKTGYSDVELRNNPILQTSDDAPCQIGLIDLEHYESSVWGLFGMTREIHGISRNGLMRLGGKQLQDRIFQIAKKAGLFGNVHQDNLFDYTNTTNLEVFKQTAKERLLELEQEEKLNAFYQTKRITRSSMCLDPLPALQDEFTDKFLPFFTKSQQLTFAKEIYQTLNTYLAATDESLPMNLARLVNLEISTKSIEFTMFCTSFLAFLKQKGRIFDFRQDPYNTSDLIVQC